MLLLVRWIHLLDYRLWFLQLMSDIFLQFMIVFFNYNLSPRIRMASFISDGNSVTRFAWLMQRTESWKTPTRYASLASCNASIVNCWNRKPLIPGKFLATSRTSRLNGIFLIIKSVDFWYRLISRIATVPGRYLVLFIIPPGLAMIFLAALFAKHFLACIPSVHLWAVCLVLTMVTSCKVSTPFMRFCFLDV